MPSKKVDLNSWGVADLEVLLNHYVVEKKIGGKTLPPLANSNECRREFFNFKLQGPWIGVTKHSRMFGL